MAQENKFVIEDIVKNMGCLVVLTLKPIEQGIIEKIIGPIVKTLGENENINYYVNPNTEIGYINSLGIDEKLGKSYIQFSPIPKILPTPLILLLDEVEECTGVWFNKN